METDAFPAPAAKGGNGKKAKAAGGTSRPLILARVARDARLDRNFLLLITLASAIATLGLLQGSTPVVIGAMLVSPLMGPIMGLGFGLATIDSALIRRSLITLAAGSALAILVAVALIWLSPMRDVTDELRARTEPTLLDLAVAVVGGVAGVYAILRKLSGVMVGVAIATALVPPLSTIGFGIVTARPEFALGAALLFLTNTLAISLAATAVARFNRFGPSLTPEHTAMQVAGIVTVLGILSIPLALSLNQVVREASARQVVQAELGARLGRAARIERLEVLLVNGSVVIEGLALVERFDPDLNPALARQVGQRLARKVTANMVQIRQEEGTTVDAARKLSDRVSALEAANVESTDVVRALGVGAQLDRRNVLVDAHLRHIMIFIPQDFDAAGRQAIDDTVATVRADYPLWTIDVAQPSGGAQRSASQNRSGPR